MARKSALAPKRAALLERTGSPQAELVVSRVLLEPWGSHQSPSPWSYSSGSWRGWPWSSDPTPTRPWCQPRRLGQRRKALQPRLPIPAPNTQLTRRRRGLDWEDQAAQPAKQHQLCAILSFADAGVENLSPPHHIRGWIPLAPGARLALTGFFNKTAHLG